MASLAETAADQDGCPGVMVEGLTSTQLATLHAYKHTLIAETFDLYTEIPPERADKIIAHFFQEILRALT